MRKSTELLQLRAEVWIITAGGRDTFVLLQRLQKGPSWSADGSAHVAQSLKSAKRQIQPQLEKLLIAGRKLKPPKMTFPSRQLVCFNTAVNKGQSGRGRKSFRFFIFSKAVIKWLTASEVSRSSSQAVKRVVFIYFFYLNEPLTGFHIPAWMEADVSFCSGKNEPESLRVTTSESFFFVHANMDVHGNLFYTI